MTTDVLKLAEEALGVIPALARQWVDSAVEAHAELANSEDWEVSQANREAFEARCADTLTAIRAARAEWGWRPIAEMLDTDKSVTCGKWIKLYRKWEWVTQPGWGNKKAAQMSGYTHFCRPQLPTPPAREEVGNG